MPLKVGDKAPDFTLPDPDKKPRSLKEFLGKKTVLAFFPGAFTGVCTKEMCTLRDSLANFSSMNAQVVAVCVDAPATNKAFTTYNNLLFPVLSDYTRSTIRAYDIVHDGFGGLSGYQAALRSVFILDNNGVVKYVWITKDPGVEPPYQEVEKALSSF